MRHHGATLIVTARPTAGRARRQPRAWMLAGWSALLVVFVLSAITLYTGIPLDRSEPAGPCPQKLSRTVSSSGATLQIYPERTPYNDLVLIHLCAEAASAPVRQWQATLNSPGETAAELTVVPVAQRLGLAAIELPTGLHPRLQLTILLESGALSRVDTTL